MNINWRRIGEIAGAGLLMTGAAVGVKKLATNRRRNVEEKRQKKLLKKAQKNAKKADDLLLRIEAKQDQLAKAQERMEQNFRETLLSMGIELNADPGIDPRDINVDVNED